MRIRIDRRGHFRAIYGEMIDLHSFGRLSIRRASNVEPTSNGHWLADLSPVGGPLLGPFQKRSEAIQAELDWLSEQL